MAQAHIEGITDYLNEARRSSEQAMIVQYLGSNIQKLHFKLSNTNQILLRQDPIQWVVSSKTCLEN